MRPEFSSSPTIVGSPRRRLLAASILGGLAAVAVASAASAQDVAKPADDKKEVFVIEELVVTAQPHEAALQDAPLSVTTFDAEERNLISANTTRQLVDLTPGVFLSDFGLNIRGVGRGTLTTTLGSENSVALYVNGFYNVDSGTIGESTLFGGNVQFMRGPQGTFYGRDAIGGAVNLISRRPTKEPMGEVVIGYGQRNWASAGITVAGPISDRYRVRLGLQQINQGDQTQKNIAPYKAGFDSDNLYAEVQLEGDVTDNLHFLLRSTHFEYMNSPSYTSPARYNSAGAFMGALSPNPHYRYGVASPTEPRVINVDFRGADRLTGNQVHILNADYDLGKAKLYYVGGYANYKSKGTSDLDLTSRSSYTAVAGDPVPVGTTVYLSQVANYLNRNEYYSHELRLQADEPTNLDWALGAYFFKSNYNEKYWQSMPDVIQLATPLNSVTFAPVAANPERAFFAQQNILRQQSAALFGHVTYSFTDKLTVTGGLRYTADAKRATTNFRYVYWSPAVGVALDVSPAVHGGLYKIDDGGVTARLDTEYRPSKDVMYYASYARGYKAGGFTLGDAVTNNISKPEKLDTYEVGLKRDFVGANLRIEAAAFYYDYTNYQVPITALNTTTGGTFARYTNAAKAEIYGLELQTDWSPVEQVNLSLGYTFLHGVSKDFCCAVDFTKTPAGGAPIAEDLSGRDLPRTPHHKVSLSGTYTIDLGGPSLILGGSAAYTGAMYANAFENDVYKMKGYTVTNLTATYRSSDNRYDVVLAGTNVFDVNYATQVAVGGANLGFARTEYLGPPQFINLTLRYRF